MWSATTRAGTELVESGVVEVLVVDQPVEQLDLDGFRLVLGSKPPEGG